MREQLIGKILKNLGIDHTDPKDEALRDATMNVIASITVVLRADALQRIRGRVLDTFTKVEQFRYENDAVFHAKVERGLLVVVDILFDEPVQQDHNPVNSLVDTMERLFRAGGIRRDPRERDWPVKPHLDARLVVGLDPAVPQGQAYVVDPNEISRVWREDHDEYLAAILKKMNDPSVPFDFRKIIGS